MKKFTCLFVFGWVIFWEGHLLATLLLQNQQLRANESLAQQLGQLVDKSCLLSEKDSTCMGTKLLLDQINSEIVALRVAKEGVWKGVVTAPLTQPYFHFVVWGMH